MKKKINLYLICVFSMSVYIGFVSTFKLEEIRTYLEMQSFLSYDKYINNEAKGHIYKEMYSRECYVGVKGYLYE